MRILLLHPEDSPLGGPWSRERWDLIVDLGRSSRFSEERWSRLRSCPVLRSDTFTEGIADIRRVRDILAAPCGVLLDEHGIDWWGLTNLRIVPGALAALTLRRVASEIPKNAELWTTRPSWQADVVARAGERPVRSFAESALSRSVALAARYAALLQNFSAAQVRQIFWDRHDSTYRWRARFAQRPKPSSQPIVLLPSAYENVSRMAAAYARLVPEQAFLLVATRWSARQFSQTANVQVRDLAAYANGEYPAGEIAGLIERWTRLRAEMSVSPDFRMLSQAGLLESFPDWFRDGVCARDAWMEVLKREPVCGVLCGDDSNMYTRLPVLLAARQKVPTTDFHHGAFDGHYLIKKLPGDTYLAKNEMERDYLLRVCGLPGDRVVIGAPGKARSQETLRGASARKVLSAAVYFSEPYEAASMRAEEVYREILPPLVRLARKQGRELIVKLHPFESRVQRGKLIRQILSREESEGIRLVDGPLTQELLAKTWFGITVESTTVMDCHANGVCCFLCEWLAPPAYGYVEQYGRFGVGEQLQSAVQISEIPARLADWTARFAPPKTPAEADAAGLRRWLTSGLRENCATRSAS